MTKFNRPAIFILIAITCCSCAATGPQINLYGPVMYARDIAYQPKPMSTDSVHHGTYASIAYSSGNAPNDKNGDDVITSGQLNISRGVTYENFNLSYGAFGEIGAYQNETDNDPTKPNYFSARYFQVLGGRFSANAFVNAGNVDVRFIGFEMAYSKEFGAYAAYRDGLYGQANYFVNTRTDLLTLGGTSEVIWHSRRAPMEFALKLFIGESTGDVLYRNPNDLSQVYKPQYQTVSFAYYMQLKNYFFIAELNNPNGGLLRVGIRF